MKIIYISHWRFPSEKTMSPLIMKTCEMFAEGGIEVELWIPWRQNRWFAHFDPFEHHGIERNFIIRRIPSLDFTATFPGSFFFFLMLVTFQVSAFLYLLFTPSILYFHDVRDALLPALWGKPMFLEIHDFYKSKFGWINRRVFSRITGFIVTNRFKMEALKNDFGIPENKMLHQPNAVDIAMFGISISRNDARQKLNLPAEQKIILYTGHLFYWKGVDVLLEAAKQFSIFNFQFSKNTEFIFVGGTDADIANFRKKAEGHGNVKIMGRRPHWEIPLWQKAADILVLPSPAKYPESKYETSPVKLFEYMASGTPIVASDVPSVRNIVDERFVFFFEPDNPRKLAEAVRSVLANPGEAEKKAVAARKEVEKYSWERRKDAILSLIDRRLIG